MVILCGDFQRLQMKTVEGSLHSAHLPVFDPEALGTDVIVVLQVLVEVIQAIVLPIDRQPGTQKIARALLIVLIGVADIDLCLASAWVSDMSGHSGQSGAVGAGRERVTAIEVGDVLAPTRRRIHALDNQLIASLQLVLETPGSALLVRQDDARHAFVGGA
ncbi:hypothetical protein ALQ16_201266 [Pseudomonas syringae pv. actinidiae]|nr:hypothetical protein ALQ16_201266 [Pseudomonas syringae pv. actinidiae]